jgi:hypothetical protein
MLTLLLMATLSILNTLHNAVDTHELCSWYFITQAALSLNPGAIDARRISVSYPFLPILWRQNTLATKPNSLSNAAVLANELLNMY